MTEFGSRIRPSWIAFGWFIAAAVTSLVLLALVSLGIISDNPDAERVWVGVALALGFGTAGFFVGTRVLTRPELHGLGMAAFSLLAWVLVNLLLGEPTDQTAWATLGTDTVIGLLVLQAAAAVVGARMGVRWATRR